MQKKMIHRLKLSIGALLMSAMTASAAFSMGGCARSAYAADTVSGSEVAFDVKIAINVPEGWFSDKAKVSFEVEELSGSADFKVKSVKAKIGQNGSYQDVTDDMSLEVTENCSVYVAVTDSNGKVYERSRRISCFDTTKPTLNAAVNNGVLTVKAVDSESGVKVIYVNGYDFNEFDDGVLTVRLKKFDEGYEYFTVQAQDNAGNMSEVYKSKNPYYKDKSSKSGSSGSSNSGSSSLPISVSPTRPASATATVTSHTTSDTPAVSAPATIKVDAADTSALSPVDQKKAEFKKADEQEKAMAESDDEEERTEPEKEFYTIAAASGKVFYLIIDRATEEEKVYFLTEITENDLLNVTSDNKEELPMNSAAIDSGIPVEEEATEEGIGQEYSEMTVTREPEEIPEEEPGEPVKDEPKKTPAAFYLVLGILGLGVICGVYYLKFIYRRDERDYAEEDDEDEDETLSDIPETEDMADGDSDIANRNTDITDAYNDEEDE